MVEADRNQDKTGKTTVSGKELADTAGTAGNPVRALQALPGVTSRNDVNSEPAIRGSAPYNNAYYVDFMPVGYLDALAGIEQRRQRRPGERYKYIYFLLRPGIRRALPEA